MKIIAICEQCARWHPIEFDPLVGYGNAVRDWYGKHAGHDRVEVRWPGRSLKKRLLWHGEQILDALGNKLLQNADVKLVYATSAAYTITLGSLATSATLVAGRESTAVANNTNLYLDYLIGGIVTVGTTPTINTQIEVWAYSGRNGTPTYPDVFDGTDSDETVTSVAIKAACLRLLAVMGVDATTSDRGYHFAQVSLAACYGGSCPRNHGLFVVHNTAVNLNSTGGNHVIDHIPVYATVA